MVGKTKARLISSLDFHTLTLSCKMIFVYFLIIVPFFLFSSAFAGPEQGLQEAIKKFENITEKQDDCRPDFSPSGGAKSTLEKICNKNQNIESTGLNSSSLEQMYRKIHFAYLNFIIKSPELSPDQKDALTQRVRKISDLNVNFCDSTSIHYDNLENKIVGCISKKTSLTQLGLILSHELGHAIGPCAYHASWSPFKVTKLAKTLKYSKPMDYQSSLEEYPFKKKLKCQPAETTEPQLMNQVSNESWNVMCAKSKQEELFADLMGASIYAEILQAQSGIQNEQFLELARVLCPSKGLVKEVKIENGKTRIVERIDWLEPGDYPKFELRLAALYEGLTYKKALNSDRLFFNSGVSLKSCF